MTPWNKLQRRLAKSLEQEKRDLRELRAQMDRVARIMGDVSWQNKASWPGFLERALGAVLDGSGLYDTIHAYMTANNRHMAAEDVPLGLHYFGLSWERNVLFERGDTRAFRCWTNQGEEFYVAQYGDNTEWDLYLDEGVDLQAIFGYLSEQLWASRRALRLDFRQTTSYGGGEIVISDMPLRDQRYIGSTGEHIQEWGRFKEAAIRRSVLLQGKPGSGKSTLCLHAADELSERTALVTAAVFESLSTTEWRNLMDILSPQMLILDDIDRVGDFVLASRLEIFEERNCEIPFVFFTSNDISKIPDAFRRPGRIDQILIVEEPDADVRREMVRRFAENLDVEVPDAHIERLQAMIVSHSGAHAFEALKRGKVLGWDHGLRDDDITFKTDTSDDSDDD